MATVITEGTLPIINANYHLEVALQNTIRACLLRNKSTILYTPRRSLTVHNSASSATGKLCKRPWLSITNVTSQTYSHLHSVVLFMRNGISIVQ